MDHDALDARQGDADQLPLLARANSATSPRAAHEQLAIQQLFNAAADLGVDTNALNELLVRSTSTSSRSTPFNQSPLLTRNNSVATPTAHQRQGTAASDHLSRSGSVKSPVSPVVSFVNLISVCHLPQLFAKAPSMRSDTDASETRVVRRTLIFPSDHRAPTATTSVSRKPSHRKKPSESGFSIRSGKSVHDRAPTPPPPKVAASKRFSTDTSPPVPNFPATFSQFLDASAPGGSERGNSSIFDLYAHDGRVTPSERDNRSSRSPYPASSTSRSHGGAEAASAVEILELSSGQVVWKVVDGLRAAEDFDYDDASGYRSRQSFASEYSMPSPARDDAGIQVFVREHKRMSSKGSASSSAFYSRPGHGTSRPETKVRGTLPQTGLLTATMFF